MEDLAAAVTQKLCQLDQHKAASLLQPDQVASKVVDFGVGLEVDVVAAPAVGSVEASAGAIEQGSVVEEEGLATKVGVDSAEEADLVMVPCPPLMHHLVLAGIEEASAPAPVGMLVHLLTAVRLARLLQRMDPMLFAVGMAIQDVMAHMTTDPRIAEVAAAVDMAIEAIGVIAAQEASLVVIASR